MKFVLAGLLLGLGAAVKFSGTSVVVLGGNLSAPKEALISIVRKASQEDGMENDATVSSLANMAENMVRMSANQDPTDMQQSVGTIRNLIEDMLAKVQQDAQIAWSGVYNNSRFESCTSTMYACMGRDTPNPPNILYQQCLNELAALQAMLDACRSQQQNCTTATTELCNVFYAIDKKFGGTYDPDPSTGKDWRDHGCDDAFSGSYPDYLQRYVTWLEDWRAKKAACDGSQVGPCANQTNECAALQAQVDAKSAYCESLQDPIPDGCLPWLHKETCCSTYDLCFTDAETARVTATATANQLMGNLRAQWRSLKRMECLLDVLVLEGDQTAALEACIARTHSTDALDVEGASAPVEATCAAGTSPSPECPSYEVHLGPAPPPVPVPAVDPVAPVAARAPPSFGNTAGTNLFR